MLNDLATTMPGAGAGAVFSGSGADDELRRQFERFDISRESDLDPGDQCMCRTTAHTHRIAHPRPNADSDADANVLASNQRGGLRAEYGVLQYDR
jgi:hypothetical protein